MKLIDCNTNDFVWVQVQKDDDLNSILNRYQISKNNIVRNNPNVDLYDGEMIKIVHTKHTQHIVKPMKTLLSIADKYNVDVDDLVSINNLNSKRLFIGQTLIVYKDKN